MSNSVRTIAPGRGVDAATRAAPGVAADTTGDDGFAAVMNLAIGAASGLGAAPRDGGDAAADAAADPGIGTASLPRNAGTAALETVTTGTQPGANVAPATDGVTTQSRGGPQVRTGDPAAIVAAIAGPTSSATKPVQHRSEDLAVPPRHRDHQAPHAGTTDAIPVAALVAPAIVAPPSGRPAIDPSDRRSDATKPSAVLSGADTGSDAIAVRSAAPDMPLDARFAAGLTPIIPASKPVAAAGAPARPTGNRFGIASVTDAAPPNDASADPTDEFGGIRPVARGRTDSEDPAVSVTPPTVAAMVRTSGPADHSAGQNSGTDQPGPLSPAFDNNPAVGSTSVIGNGVPVENPTPATVQPTIIAIAAPIATMPILPAPRPRQTNADSALAGASGALIGTPSPAPDAGVAPLGDTGSVGAPPQSFGDALANHVLSMASAGHQETTLQLQPPQLGDLTVRIAVQGRDVSAWFGAAQPQVQQAVGQALDQLRLDLAGAGFNLAGAWVGADTSGTPRQFDTATMPGRRFGFAASSIGRAANDKADSPQLSSGVSVYV